MKLTKKFIKTKLGIERVYKRGKKRYIIIGNVVTPLEQLKLPSAYAAPIFNKLK